MIAYQARKALSKMEFEAGAPDDVDQRKADLLHSREQLETDRVKFARVDVAVAHV